MLYKCLNITIIPAPIIEQILFWLPRVTRCLLEMMVRLQTQWLWSRKLAALVEPVGRSAFGCSGCYPRLRLNCLLLTQLPKKQVPQPWYHSYCSFFFFLNTVNVNAFSFLHSSLMIHGTVQTYVDQVNDKVSVQYVHGSSDRSME